MTRPKGRLEWDTYIAVTDKIRNHFPGQRFSLSFSGMGEPLLHPLIFKFVRHVSDVATTSFASNGSALTEQNTAKLIEAGLDLIYFSFNGDEPELYEKMMGGLSFHRVVGNLRRAIALARGTRLRISANISVTKANRHRLTAIQHLLADEGITQFSYAMAHTRGGNLRDPEVFDTPPIPEEVTHCEVIKNTLFIDWRGRVLICDHDLHGEYSLGDLVAEPIATVLQRRQFLVENGVGFKICGHCNDVLKMGTDLFPDLRSGTLRDWVYDVYREDGEPPLSQANPKMKWLYTLYAREDRLDRLVNRLLARSKDLETIAADKIHAHTRVDELNQILITREARIQELDSLARAREQRIHELERERVALKNLFSWRLLRLEKIVRRWLQG